jgi:hypothetical protein
VGPDQEDRREGKKEEGAGRKADLKVRDPPLAQLGVGVGDEDDRVVLSWHRRSVKFTNEASWSEGPESPGLF